MTINKINNKKYIGQHTTEILNDGYLGSGVALRSAIKKYGRENFKRIILAFANNPETLNELEIEYIKQYNAVENQNFYNIAKGGLGGNATQWTREQREKQSKIIKFEYETGKRISHMKGKRGSEVPFYGKHHTQKTKEILSKQKKEQWEKGLYDATITPERAKKISETRKQKYRDGEYTIRDVSGEKNPMFGKTKELSPVYGTHKTQEQKTALSKIAKKQYENGRIPVMQGKHWSEESKKKMSESHIGIATGSKNGRAVAIICVETKEYFGSIKDAMEKYGCSRETIMKCCKDQNRTYNNLHFQYASHANTVPSSKEKV